MKRPDLDKFLALDAARERPTEGLLETVAYAKHLEKALDVCAPFFLPGVTGELFLSLYGACFDGALTVVLKRDADELHAQALAERALMGMP